MGSLHFFACQQCHKEVVSLLLADMRIEAHKPHHGFIAGTAAWTNKPAAEMAPAQGTRWSNQSLRSRMRFNSSSGNRSGKNVSLNGMPGVPWISVTVHCGAQEEHC